MTLTRNKTTVAGLDLQAGSIAGTEITSNGSVELGGTAIAALDPGLTRDGEVAQPEELGRALKSFFSNSGLSRNVRIGIASQRVVVRTLRLPLIEDPREVETAIRFQAAEEIPMPLEGAVLEWQVLRADPRAPLDGQMDVAVVAARREAVGGIIEACRAAGLKPVGIDISAFGMIRALATPQSPPDVAFTGHEEATADEPVGSPSSARLLCNLGDVLNLAVASGPRCLFTRVSTFGMEAIVQQVSDRASLTPDHARQWMQHVGLVEPIEGITGDPRIVEVTRSALDAGVEKLAGEMRLSLDYYGSQEAAVPVDEVILCGAGSAVTGVPERLQRELGHAVGVGRPPALSHLDDASAARLTLAYGLALEE